MDGEDDAIPEKNTASNLLTEAEEVLRLFSVEQEVCGRFLGQYVKWDAKTSELIVRDKRMGHLKAYLRSFLSGFAFPPIVYFDYIYGHLRNTYRWKSQESPGEEEEKENGSAVNGDADSGDAVDIGAISSFFSIFVTLDAPKRQVKQ